MSDLGVLGACKAEKPDQVPLVNCDTRDKLNKLVFSAVLTFAGQLR